MRIVDLSPVIETGMEMYPGDPRVAIELVQTIDDDGWDLRRVEMGSHTGSHVDAFSHVTSGAPSIDRIPLERFTGPARRVTSSHNLPRELGLLLDFDPVQEDIQPILDAGAPFIGSARLSIEIERPLLNAGILTFDGLVNLRGLPLDQTFEFYGFPLKIREGDGSPIRAIAILE